MSDSAKVIECPRGALINGDSADDVVAKAQDYGKEAHDMELSNEQALAMVRIGRSRVSLLQDATTR